MTRTYLVDEEVLQQALDALAGAYLKDLHDDALLTKVIDAKIAVKAILAKGPSESVAEKTNKFDGCINWTCDSLPKNGTLLYTKDTP